MHWIGSTLIIILTSPFWFVALVIAMTYLLFITMTLIGLFVALIEGIVNIFRRSK